MDKEARRIPNDPDRDSIVARQFSILELESFHNRVEREVGSWARKRNCEWNKDDIVGEVYEMLVVELSGFVKPANRSLERWALSLVNNYLGNRKRSPAQSLFEEGLVSIETDIQTKTNTKKPSHHIRTRTLGESTERRRGRKGLYAPRYMVDPMRQVVEALEGGRISVNDAVALTMRYLGHEYSYIADRQGISEEALRQRVVRAIKKLRTLDGSIRESSRAISLNPPADIDEATAREILPCQLTAIIQTCKTHQSNSEYMVPSHSMYMQATEDNRLRIPKPDAPEPQLKKIAA